METANTILEILKAVFLAGIITTGFFKQAFYPQKDMPKQLRYNVHEAFKIFVSSYAALELVLMFL